MVDRSWESPAFRPVEDVNVSTVGIGQFCPPPSWVSGSVLMLGVILVLGFFLVAMNELWAFPILAV